MVLAQVPFVPLDNPIAPVHAGKATGPQITEANRAFDAQQRDFATMSAVRTKLRSMLINAVEPLYFATLQDPRFGLNYVTIPTMVVTLVSTYGKITPEELEANRASLLTAWDITQPIEQLWSRHATIRQIAAAAETPLSDRIIMDQTIVLFRNRVVFVLGLDAWRRLPTASKRIPSSCDTSLLKMWNVFTISLSQALAIIVMPRCNKLRHKVQPTSSI